MKAVGTLGVDFCGVWFRSCFISEGIHITCPTSLDGCTADRPYLNAEKPNTSSAAINVCSLVATSRNRQFHPRPPDHFTSRLYLLRTSFDTWHSQIPTQQFVEMAKKRFLDLARCDRNDPYRNSMYPFLPSFLPGRIILSYSSQV